MTEQNTIASFSKKLDTKLTHGTRRIVWMNAPILTKEGEYHYEKIGNIEEVLKLICYNTNSFAYYDYLSAVGHEASVEAFNVVLKDFYAIPKVILNRIVYTYEPGDMCIVLKMRGRVQEGKVLDRAAMEEIGYDFHAIWETSIPVEWPEIDVKNIIMK